jgi:hypothetical protein
MIGTPKGTPNDVEASMNYEFTSAMPTCQMNPEKHRNKCIRLGIPLRGESREHSCCKACREKEIRANPKAQQALDVEWEKLVKKKAWQYETVSEWKVIADKGR